MIIPKTNLTFIFIFIFQHIIFALQLDLRLFNQRFLVGVAGFFLVVNVLFFFVYNTNGVTQDDKVTHLFKA